VNHTILWRRLDIPGHEIGRLKSLDEGTELSGTAVFSNEGRPCKLDYVVIADSGWRTKSAKISGTFGDRVIDISVSVKDDRKWLLNGVQCEVVSGCVDIDLGFSPSTNLLPIRRLSLNVGEEAEVIAAWLPFPSLEFEVLRQTYQRVGKTTYRYESGGGVFKRLLKVNEVGFVTNYPGLWIEDGKEEAG